MVAVRVHGAPHVLGWGLSVRSKKAAGARDASRQCVSLVARYAMHQHAVLLGSGEVRARYHGR